MKRILIIEDDALIASVYKTKYASAGFETRIASDGEEGLELLKTFKPDLVHLDLLVPKVNGADIIRHIRNQPELKSLPVIVLTNTYQNRLVKTAMEAGATECVSKATCTPKMMVEIVEKLWDRMHRAATLSQPAPAIAPDTAPPAASEGTANEPAAVSPTPDPPTSTDADHIPDSATTEIARHTSFHIEVNRDFLRRAPQMLAALRGRIEPLLRAETDADRVPELSELRRTAHSFAGHAGIAGFQELSQMSSALVALLGELIERPKELTPSSLRTLVDASDFLGVLLERATESPTDSTEPAVVLVVDDEVISRRAVTHALSRLNVATISVDDSQVALKLLAENRFSLIFLDVDMPGINGFDLCKELRTLPANHATPVVFVTSLSGFEGRERSISSGGNDLIAKPFLPMELAVKALSLLRQSPSPQY